MADNCNIDDVHGFFQFANCSDSEDGDGLFVSAKPRKAEFDVHAINYTQKIDEDEWFDRSQTTSVDEWMNTHSGLDEIMFTVQNMYFKGQYSRAADLCKQAVLAFVEKRQTQLRVASMRELLEIGAKSAIRTDSIDLLEYFYDWYEQCGGKNPGYSYFRAEALAKLGRLDQALEQYIDYLEMRKLDAQVWELIGELLVSIGGSQQYAEPIQRISWQRLALGAFFVSHRIIDGSNGWKSSELAVKRRQLQTEQLLKHATETMCKISTDAAAPAADSGSEDSFWGQCKAESTLDEPSQQRLLKSCAGSLATSVTWILAHFSHGSMDDTAGADDDEKNAADL
ncbi:hypothetical protein GGI20_005320 [Coemansia sp. BCRC 34301]|nr:hypothetical protein GGI20_005320 [Coemansia sp. BCRC 34301]